MLRQLCLTLTVVRAMLRVLLPWVPLRAAVSGQCFGID